MLLLTFVGAFLSGVGACAFVMRSDRRKRDVRELLRIQNRNELQLALASSSEARAYWEQHQGIHEITIVNLAQFVILWNMDLSALLNALDDTEPGWQQKLHARVLALTIYECAEDFTALLGKNLREAITELAGPQQLTILNPVSAGINQFWRSHREALKAIRGSIIAHRDHNAKQQIEALNNLSVEEVKSMGWELMKWTNTLLSALSNTVNVSNSKRRL